MDVKMAYFLNQIKKMNTNFLICGDFCPQDRVSNLINRECYSNILGDDIITKIKGADISIVNLECPVVDGDKFRAITKAGPNLKGNINMIKCIKFAGFNVVTLANNHILDYGDKGIKMTLETLKDNEIMYVGAGNNLTQAQEPLIINHHNDRFGIINICESEFSIASETTFGANPIDLITLYSQVNKIKNDVDYMILIIHGGHEHYQLPSPRMKKLYRHFIDIGFDVVVNHHQHCYSGYEKYKNKYIFYGLGNFCFDRCSERNSIWNEGFMLDLTFANGNISFKMYPYIQANNRPGIILMDDNQEKAFMENINKLNSIISDDNLLEAEFVKWIKKNKKRYESYLSPYGNRYLRFLCRLGILPTMLNQNRKNVLLDMIQCESHNDIILKLLKNEY